jgi:hypothetical protein
MAPVTSDARSELRYALSTAVISDPANTKIYRGLIHSLDVCMKFGDCGGVVCPVCLVAHYLAPLETELQAQFGAFELSEVRYVALRAPELVSAERLKRAVGDIRASVTTLTKRGTGWANAIDTWAAMIHPAWVMPEDSNGQGGLGLTVRCLAHLDSPFDKGAISDEWDALLRKAKLSTKEARSMRVVVVKRLSVEEAVKRVTRVRKPLPVGFDTMPATALLACLGQVKHRRKLLGRATLSPVIREATRAGGVELRRIKSMRRSGGKSGNRYA